MDPLPADRIRLLRIEAGVDESPICCRLVTTSLQSSPSYEALSYTWGSLEQDSTITCDGFSMAVTHHLYDALQYLRKPECERVMWIDAVCIDQRNDKERTEQVGIMKDIYREASRVIIWLGKETLEDKIAFSLLDQFKDVFAKYDFIEFGPEHYISLGLPKVDSPEWTELVKLFQRPWFRRIWVIQEATMARESTVVCGSYSVPWDLISKVARSARKNGHLGRYAYSFHAPGVSSATFIHFLNQAHKIQQPGWGLLGLLRLTRKFLATDPRDKVFALVGVVRDTNSVGLEVDYTLSTEEVYSLVAVHNLKKLKDMELLANGGICSVPQNPNLPSWVPDWSHNNDHKAIIAAVAKRTKMCAAGDSREVLSISADKKILTIRGMIIDSILRLDASVLVSEEVFKRDNISEVGEVRVALRSKACFENYEALAEAAYKFPEGQTRKESLWRTLCCDITAEIPTRRAPAEYAGAYEVTRKIHTATAVDGHIDWAAAHNSTGPEDIQHYTAFLSTVGLHCAGKNLCITSGGYLGQAPSSSLVGDQICILFGSNVPFVLRECNDGFFKLIGECFIHGIMEGQAMKVPDIETLSQDFKIF